MAQLLNSLQDGTLFSLIRGSAHAYLVLLALHMVALALFGGMILVTDLRLLGLGLRGYSVAEVVNGLRVPKRFGLALAVVTGALMFGAQANQYSRNAWFCTKIALLALIAANCLLFRRRLYDGGAPQTSGNPKLTAGLSLLLWTAVICAGRGPATIKDVMHSMIDPSGDYIFQSVEEVADEHGAHENAPKTDEEWDELRQRLMILQQAPTLLEDRRAARPRDRSRNPQSESQPEQIEATLDADPASLLRRARRLQDAANSAVQAVDAKNKDALLLSIDKIDKACENCHLHYWYPNDKRAQQAAKEDGVTDY